MKKALSFFTGGVVSDSRVNETVYLLFRLHAGISIAYGAGYYKMFTKINEKLPWEWYNLRFGTSAWFTEQVGALGFTFPSPEFWAYMATYGEFIGGICIALGLFTRISAIQLAFQFFVISFLWYESPEPVYGMYYQQLFFFCFLMIAGKGGGLYSIDNAIFRRRRAVPAKEPQLSFGGEVS